jgi:hypothetical protein
MLNIIGLLASGVAAVQSPAHYIVDLTAVQDNRVLAVSHLVAQTGQSSQLVQEDSGQHLNIKVTPRSGDGGAVKLALYIELSAENGTITRKTSTDAWMSGDRHFSVDVPAEGDQPAAHFEFTVEEAAPARPS